MKNKYLVQLISDEHGELYKFTMSDNPSFLFGKPLFNYNGMTVFDGGCNNSLIVTGSL